MKLRCAAGIGDYKRGRRSTTSTAVNTTAASATPAAPRGARVAQDDGQIGAVDSKPVGPALRLAASRRLTRKLTIVMPTSYTDSTPGAS